MVSPNVSKLLDQTKSLSLEEREQFLESLKQLCSEQEATRHSEGDDFAAALAKKGIKLTVPPKRTPEELERFRAWRPITLPGGSLSDELIRDRR